MRSLLKYVRRLCPYPSQELLVAFGESQLSWGVASHRKSSMYIMHVSPPQVESMLLFETSVLLNRHLICWISFSLYCTDDSSIVQYNRPCQKNWSRLTDSSTIDLMSSDTINKFPNKSWSNNLRSCNKRFVKHLQHLFLTTWASAFGTL